MNFFDGCTALITGASSGLGVEFARQLAPHAKSLILVARRGDKLEEVKAEVAREGLVVHCFPVDLQDGDQIEALLRELAVKGERVTLLINNAGLGDHGFFEQSDWSRVKAMLDVNITALTRFTHAMVPDLVHGGGGAILNVSSVAGLMPLPKMSVYAASKAYVTSFSEALRGELRGTGVSVTSLCPGPVDTGFSAIAQRPNAEDQMPAPEMLKVSAEQVVREALLAVSRDRAKIIPGWLICFLMTLATLVPICFLRLGFAQRRPQPSKRPASSHA